MASTPIQIRVHAGTPHEFSVIGTTENLGAFMAVVAHFLETQKSSSPSESGTPAMSESAQQGPPKFAEVYRRVRKDGIVLSERQFAALVAVFRKECRGRSSTGVKNLKFWFERVPQRFKSKETLSNPSAALIDASRYGDLSRVQTGKKAQYMPTTQAIERWSRYCK